MKKFLALALAVLMIFSIAACSKDNKTTTGKPDDSTTGKTDDSTTGKTNTDLKVSVFWYDESDVYLGSVRSELNAKLDAAGIKYDNQYAAKDQAKQMEQINTAIAGGSNLLVVNVVTSGDPDIAKNIVEAAGNIPVVFFNRAIGDQGSDVTMLNSAATACFIGTDAPEAGHMQGKMIGEYVLANFDKLDINGDGKISYAMMKGEEGNAEAIYRTQYAVEDANAVLTAAGKAELVYFDASAEQKWQTDLEGAWSAKAAKEYMDTNLISYNESNGNMIELVICNNDGMAEGVISSLQQAGYNENGKRNIPVFGVDATDNAKQLISEGAMIGTVKQDAEGMALAICETVKAVAGGKTPVDALKSLNDSRLSVAADCASKLYVAYAAYTGEGGNDDTDNTDYSKLKVSVFWYDESDVYLGSVRAELNAKLDAAGIKYDNQYAAKDQAKQMEQINTAIAGGSNLLVVNVVTSGDPDIAQNIVDAAGDIPVVFFNRAIGDEGTDVTMLNSAATACFIGTDAPEAGHMQGKMIGEYVLAHYDDLDINGDGKISYAMMKGEEGNAEAIYRTQYAVEDANAILTAAGKPELVYFDESAAQKWQTDLEGAWSSKAAKEYMDTNLISHNESANNMIELVICNNDGMAEGVISSLQQAGYNEEGKRNIPVFGVDATDNAKQLISEGAMIGTVKQDAEGMALAICETVKAIAGGKTPVDALKSLNDSRLSIASDCASKLYVAYAAYTGE